MGLFSIPVKSELTGSHQICLDSPEITGSHRICRNTPKLAVFFFFFLFRKLTEGIEEEACEPCVEYVYQMMDDLVTIKTVGPYRPES